MNKETPVRVFIGSGEASLLERKTLLYTLRKHTRSPLDIYVFNGTHNAIEHNDEPPVLAGMSLKVKYRNVTEFSNYRFLIPQICGYEGRAIFLDSDMICLADIAELFHAPMNGCSLLAKCEAYAGAGNWGLSVTLFDCAQSRFDLDAIFEEINLGLFTYQDFHQLSAAFLTHHPHTVGKIDPNWNVFDHYDSETKLIHYTNLFQQPWKHPGHPSGELWFKYFNEARAAGAITQQDIDTTKVRSYVRQDILEGNNPRPPKRGWRLPSVRAAIQRMMGGAK
jgi:hypothetical protein